MVSCLKEHMPSKAESHGNKHQSLCAVWYFVAGRDRVLLGVGMCGPVGKASLEL